ncbi:TetR/AcrR family transcriptional regulator [Streptomyces lonarensis]|uniref:TetR/AcrR family transcriptional regulator n=1 Tax=Streptomyces lonarensis TaxID=700599 RepID=A0A7X6D0Z2_9ACTN|nr:TetR/AcrR family transcriptional regulator [Streptomyces lonarensis]NJQ06070.1 TetR/AcrR family transcriptional regulator [Streptomyces lonarensis]
MDTDDQNHDPGRAPDPTEQPGTTGHADGGDAAGQPEATATIGAGDPRATMELLWGARPRPSRGPRPRLDAEAVAREAIALADEEGLAALSMRRLAARLGVTVMSLYTYVPGKAELVDLMLDRVLAGPDGPEPARTAPLHSDAGAAPDSGWRERLAAVARHEWELNLRHPWLLQVTTARPSLGPHVLDWYERALHAVDGVGLTEVEMDSVVDLVTNYVHGASRSAIAAADVDDRTGMTDDQWWQAVEPLLNEVWPVGRYPVADRVGPVVGELYGARIPPEQSFAFGLERLLDGVAALIEGQGREGAARG